MANETPYRGQPAPGSTKNGVQPDKSLSRQDESGDKLDQVLNFMQGLGERFNQIETRLSALEGNAEEPEAVADETRAEEGEREGEPVPAMDGPYSDRPSKSRKDAADKRIYDDASRAEAAEFQADCDKVMQMGGHLDGAPRWMAGESLLSYKQRLLSKMKKYSKTWKGTNLYAVKDSAALDILGEKIREEAKDYFTSNDSVPEGSVRKVVERDETGRNIVKFYGDPESVWGRFKMPARRVTGFNKQSAP